MNPKKILLLFIVFALCQTQAYASPWVKKDGYFNRTGGKFVYGLKHSLFSWMSIWTESREPGYKKPWEGFSTGIGQTVVYTAGGLVQLATFPIPADFPDFGIGMHIPSKECPARHAKDYVPPAKNPLSRKAAEQTAAKSAAANPTPALKPLTTPSAFSAEPEPIPAPLPAEIEESLKPVTAPDISTETEPAAIVTEVKNSEPFLAEALPEEATELEKAQEAELAAQAAAVTQAAEKILREKVTAVKTITVPEQKRDDKLPESNEDVVSVTPQTPKQTDNEEDLWDEEDTDQELADDAGLDEDLVSDEDGG